MYLAQRDFFLTIAADKFGPPCPSAFINVKNAYSQGISSGDFTAPKDFGTIEIINL